MNTTIKTPSYTLNMMKTKKFKSTRIHLSFGAQFNEKTVTTRAMIPYLMKAVTQKYPNRSDLILYLESLYSAYFTASVERIGTSHLVFFDMSIIDNHYTLDQENLLEQSFEFIHEVLYNPLFKEATFLEEFTPESFFPLYEDSMGGLCFKPKARELSLFPADLWHGGKKITSGNKYAIIFWATSDETRAFEGFDSDRVLNLINYKPIG